MQALHAQLRHDLRPQPFAYSPAAKRSCPNARRYGPCVTSGCAASRGTKAAPRAQSRADAAQASAPHPSPNSFVSVSPTVAAILATQATCLNLVVGLSATPLVCSVVGSGACGALDAGGAAVPAQVAIPAVLLAAAAQAAGTGSLVLNEFRGEVLKQQQRVASGVSDRAARGTMADTVAALKMRWSGGAVVWGAVTAAAAAASVAAISLALTALSDEGTASGNTQVLREALLGADASGKSSSGGGLPLPLLAAALLLAECVMAPLAEELVFRRVLLDALVPAPLPVPVPAPAAAPAEDSGATMAEVQQDVSQQQLQLQRGSDVAPQPDAFATTLAPEDAAQTPAAPSAASPSQTFATPAAAAAPAPAAARAADAAPAPPPAVLAWRPEWSGPLALQAAVFAAYHLNANEMLPQAALGGVLGWAYLALGRNLATLNSDGWTPLHQAAYAGAIDCVEELIKAGADVRAPCRQGDTPIHYAAAQSHHDVIEVLAKAGSPLELKDKDGETPYDVAGSRATKKLIEQLIAKREASGQDTGKGRADGEYDSEEDWEEVDEDALAAEELAALKLAEQAAAGGGEAGGKDKAAGKKGGKKK